MGRGRPLVEERRRSPLPADDDLLLIGDREVVEHFAEQVRADDQSRGRTRRIDVEKGCPLSSGSLEGR